MANYKATSHSNWYVAALGETSRPNLYLKTLPFDVLKIDQSFTLNMLNNAVDIAIIKAIVQMADGLHLKLVQKALRLKPMWIN